MVLSLKVKTRGAMVLQLWGAQEFVKEDADYSTAITNENLIQEEIKRRLNSCNVYYHSVLSSAV
jgi:hypothetical protein